MPTLTLPQLAQGMPGITPSFGNCLAEAASICLEDQKHSSGVLLNVNGDFKQIFNIIWGITTEQIRRCWADLEVTTEHGAYGIAALLVVALTDMTIVERSRKGTGFDFWLGHKDMKEPLFQNKSRLEVSGIRNGDESEIKARLRQKINQTKRSDGVLPAYVVVVEFGNPQSRVIKR